MLSVSSEQGMGQYRWNLNDNGDNKTSGYIINPKEFGMDPSIDIKPEYFMRGNLDSIAYRDIQIDFGKNPDNNSKGYIKSKGVYYLHLEVPQHVQYTTTLRIKVCAESTNASNLTGLDTAKYQEIRELVIPPAPPQADDNVIETVIVYEDPSYFRWTTEDENATLDQYEHTKEWCDQWLSPTQKNIHAGIAYDYFDDISLKAGEIYKKNNSYYKCDGTASFINNDNCKLVNYNIGAIQKDWLIAGSAPSTVAFDIVFSPKFELTSDYRYILLEIDRSNEIQQQIQYVAQDAQTYYGTFLNINFVKGTLYNVTNLLDDNKIMTNNKILNHIAVWGHPELLLSVNGEEIKVGQTDFYELEDYTIDFLGVVAKDSFDRFTIDYQYPLRIEQDEEDDGN